MSMFVLATQMQSLYQRTLGVARWVDLTSHH